jgi:hypothetical protein
MFTPFIFSQNIKGIVLDSVTKKPIELANIFFNETYYGTFTNSKGEFVLSTKNNTNDLFITNIGYESKKINLLDFHDQSDEFTFFYLKPKMEELNEIIVSNKSKVNSTIKTILSERKKTIYYGFQFGSENITFIANDFNKEGKIKNVILDLKKLKNFKSQGKKWKVEYIASLNIKFYEYDKKNKKPGKELYYKNIIVEPKNKTYKLNIDVDSLNIDFPKSGICIGVETINTKYYNPKTTFAFIAPVIKYTNTKKKEEFLSLSRYRNQGWKFITDSNWKANNFFFKTMVVDLKVKIEK